MNIKDFPYIPPNETALDQLGILLSPTEFKQRITDLTTIQNEIKRLMLRYDQLQKDWGEVEDVRNSAASLIAQGKKFKEDSEKYAAEKRAEGDAYYAQRVEAGEQKVNDIAAREKSLAEREKKATDWASTLEAKERDLEKREDQAREFLASGERQRAEGLKLKEEYTARMQKIKEAAAGASA